LLLKEAATAMSSIEHGVAIGANTWFSILAGKSLMAPRSKPSKSCDIDAFINDYNETARPFAWTKAKVHSPERYDDGGLSYQPPGNRTPGPTAAHVPRCSTPLIRGAGSIAGRRDDTPGSEYFAVAGGGGADG
jgi:hypothetical protein